MQIQSQIRDGAEACCVWGTGQVRCSSFASGSPILMGCGKAFISESRRTELNEAKKETSKENG